ncbi:MAG: AraC family transcriptional regulator [Ruminococcus sp.]|nr:AraC family transcriptional regulator [Ruminococcus sp.]
MSFIPIEPDNKMFRIQNIKFSHIDSHWHDSLEIVYIYEGDCTLLTEGIEYHLNTNDLIINNIMSIHDLYSSEECKGIVIQLSYDFLKKYLFPLCPKAQQGYFDLSPENSDHKSYKQIAEYIKHINFLNDQQEKPQIKILGYLCFILQILADEYIIEENNSKIIEQNQTLRMIMRYLQNNYKEKISRELLGEISGYSPLYISQLFRRNLGITMQDYLNHLRLENAYKELLYTDKSISFIAEDNHFSSLKYFDQCFKKTYKISPKEFRTKYQKEEMAKANLSSETLTKYGYDIIKEDIGENSVKGKKNDDSVLFAQPNNGCCRIIDFSKTTVQGTMTGIYLNIGLLEYINYDFVKRNIAEIQKTLPHLYGLATVQIDCERSYTKDIKLLYELKKLNLIPCIRFFYIKPDKKIFEGIQIFIAKTVSYFGQNGNGRFFAVMESI